MRQWSPTSLGILDRNCPAALDFYHAKKQSSLLNEKDYEIEGPEMAEIGIAFHACCYAAAHARKKDEPPWGAIEATALALTQKMPIARAQAGKNMAIDFCKHWEFPLCLNFEHGVAFDPSWRQVEWDSPARRVRLIFDACGIENVDDPEMGEITLARGQDYKTGWGVSEDELDSIQMDLYTVALRKMYPDAEGIKIEIIATRFNRIFSKLYIFGNEEDEIELQRRKDNVEFWFKAGEASDGKARVGPGCINCNFTSTCAAFQDRAESLLTPPDLTRPPEAVARDHAVLDVRYKEIETHLKAVTKMQPLTVDGSVLGYRAKTQRSIKQYTDILNLWCETSKITLPDDIKNAMNGLFVTIEPTVTQMDSVIKKIAKTLGYASQKAAIEAEGKKYYGEQHRITWGWQK